MAAFVPLMLFVVEVMLIVIVGESLLRSVAVFGDKMAAVAVALVIGTIMSVVVFFASKGGTPQPTSHSGGGHH